MLEDLYLPHSDYRYIYFMSLGQFTLIISLLISSAIYSQNKFSYIVIKIDGLYDYERSRNFLKINAENGNPIASEIYGLREYRSAKKAINTGASFYSEKSDTTSIYFNYFLTTTEIMQ